ncbi:MAG TPA: metallophosphoesterase family protein, partial [bacterium]|nr:metallophosphoesterase family protein [bacterium]
SCKKTLFDEYELTEEFVDLEIGDKVGFIASSHGNIIALKIIVEKLKNTNVKIIFHLGDIMDEHAGYLECMEYVMNEPLIKPIVGNHDLLIVNQDKVHNYEEEYLALAKRASEKFMNNRIFYDFLMNMPAKVETPYFSVVHESVKSPYYAKITKLKKKSSEYGKTPDENLEAVFNCTLPHPYFTGSDHQAYIISGSKIKRENIPPNTTVNVKGGKIISVPSVSLSKDANYTHGYCIAEILEDKSLNVSYYDLPYLLIDNNEGML